MNSKLNKIKLTEKDKNIIIKNLGICTDSHGKGCSITLLNAQNRNLN